MEILEKPKFQKSPFLAAGMAGAMAGLSVETGLYPLDTLKTRLQSAKGFHASGGFKGLYKGLAPVATACMPNAALFFITYEGLKAVAEPLLPPDFAPAAHCAAAGTAEVAYKSEGLRKGLFRGYLSTVARDLPYGCIDIPIWEYLKTKVRAKNNGEITTLQSALCGSTAALAAGAATMPLDVAKTRIMLAERAAPRQLRVLPVLRDIYRERGLRGWFAGGAPRLCSLLIGAFIFFGVYDEIKCLVEARLTQI